MDSGEEEEERTQELFGPKVILSEEDQASYAQILFPNIRPPISKTPSMSWMDNVKVKVCQARYRIAYYQAMNPVSGCKLKDPNAYSEDEIRRQKYFEHLEDDFEWFFHPDDSWNSDLNDYQKIVLQNCMPGNTEPEYPDVDAYRELYNTYEMDVVYVKYYGEISKKIKWIEEYLHLDARSAEWREMETRAWRQALRIATRLPHITVRLAAFAFNEYIYELRDDACLMGLDLVYFEIWRLVVKKNREYKEAVKEVHAMDKFHMHKRTMDAELTGAPVFQTMRQMMYGIIKKGHIVANTEDDKARDMFKKGVAHLKTKNMLNYVEKKMEIAEVLNLHKVKSPVC
uniref:Uncharacterized protein n=1 Tax=Avena sativa TaxID=4498 RepID=A0ACD5XIC9_AVESA